MPKRISVNIFADRQNNAGMRLKEMCADEMPREKLLSKGADALSNTELLAILLRVGRHGKNVIDVARELIISGGGRLSGLAQMETGQICRINGIGPGKAVAITAAFELGRRVALEQLHDTSEQMVSPKSVFRLMLPILKDLDHEECWLILLTKANRMIDRIRMSVGGQNATIIDIKAIIRKAIDRKASAVILVHNHPSGSALPSKADISQTQMLNNALKTCDLTLLDHVIIAKGSYYSFSDEELTESQKTTAIALSEKFCGRKK